MVPSMRHFSIVDGGLHYLLVFKFEKSIDFRLHNLTPCIKTFFFDFYNNLYFFSNIKKCLFTLDS